MKAFILTGIAAAAFGAAFLPASFASAAPAAPVSIEQPAAGVEQVAMRRKRMMRHHSMRRGRMMRQRSMMRRSGMGRRTTPAAMGNAANPSRPAMQQRQGGSGGGAK